MKPVLLRIRKEEKRWQMAEGVLKEFLEERRTEVVKAMTWDYTFERQIMLEREEGREALIITCKELGISFEETLEKVKKRFSLGDKEAERCMRLYW